MPKTNIFYARLDRIKAETRARAPERARRFVRPRLSASDPAKPTRKGFGLRQMVAPMTSMAVLVGGAISLGSILASDTSGPFDLQSAIAMNINEDAQSAAHQKAGY